MSEGFRLSASNKDFNDRVSGLFSSLNEVATDLTPGGYVFDSSDSGIKRSASDQFDNLPSNSHDGSFKIPNSSNIPYRSKKMKINYAPDFKNNSKNWTRYDMRDVDVLNDSQNKEAALMLFSEMRAKKCMENAKNWENDVEMVDPDEKVTFKKPTIKSSDSSTAISNKVSLPFDTVTNRKFIMDEYEVGVKKTKVKKEKKQKSKIDSKEVKLSHLDFEDDVEEEY